jgi:hypothetical protein
MELAFALIIIYTVHVETNPLYLKNDSLNDQPVNMFGPTFQLTNLILVEGQRSFIVL